MIKLRILALISIGAFILNLNKVETNILIGGTEMTVTIEQLTINFGNDVILLGGLLIIVIIWLVGKYR